MTTATSDTSSSLDRDATYFNNTTLDTSGRAGGPYYRREAVNVVNAEMDDAVSLGTLTTNETQLNVTGQLSQANSTHYYKFTLNGDSLKAAIYNYTGTSDLRVRVMDSNGKVVADSSNYADDDLAKAYDAINSEDGLDLDAGDYYLAVTVDLAELRSTAQNYTLSLYSGDHFDASYSTVASSQIKSTQHVTIDNTMVFATLDAEAYSTQDVHRANATSNDAINIGWLYENKTALSVTSLLTDVCDEEYYSFTLQKGENLKLSLDVKTDDIDDGTVRIQVLDPSGTYVYADSHGTDEQKAAYAALTSENGLDLKNSTYVVKVTYETGATQKDIEYDLKLYSGTEFDTLYETSVGTESIDTAIMQGTLIEDEYSMLENLVSYLKAAAAGESTDIMSALKETV
ncbi:MAG: hypothetical protein AB7S81_06465 [Bdellovibrionales bacterium]